MIIEQIDDNKIKVVVNEDEQKEFGVTYESMSYSDINTRKLCEKIISTAKDSIGFLVGDAKLLVEAKQGKNGTVTIVISRIHSKKDQKEEYLCQSLVFNDSSALLDACKLFLPLKDKFKYNCLYEYNGKLYLYFEIISTLKDAKKLLRNLLEYSERTSFDKNLLAEHGKIISDDNVIDKILSALN